jgi:hypothetical protein
MPQHLKNLFNFYLIVFTLLKCPCDVFVTDDQRSAPAGPTALENFESQVAPVERNRRAITKRSVRKAGSVGGSRMMECDIAYPGGRYMERIITWRKHGIEVNFLTFFKVNI